MDFVVHKSLGLVNITLTREEIATAVVGISLLAEEDGVPHRDRIIEILSRFALASNQLNQEADHEQP